MAGDFRHTTDADALAELEVKLEDRYGPLLGSAALANALDSPRSALSGRRAGAGQSGYRCLLSRGGEEDLHSLKMLRGGS